MRAGAWLSIGVLLLLFAAGGAFMGEDPLELSETSFGTHPEGHGAVFDLLSESGNAVERSYLPPNELPERATVWWIAPQDLCEKLSGEDLEEPRIAPTESGLRGWVEGGGTAVLVLPARPITCTGIPAFAGHAVPQRPGDTWSVRTGEERTGEETKGSPPTDGEDATDPKPPPEPITQVVWGSLTPARRSIESAPLRVFSEALDWRVAAEVAGEPFVLTRSVGAGRVALVADAGFLQNRALDRADASLLANDLLRAYGVPWFDERDHGLRPTPGTLAYLMRSSAMPFFMVVTLLAFLFAWSASAVPARSLPDAEPGSPTLGAFVGSLAGLYSGTGDHVRVFERYRELSEARIRRSLRLPVTTTRAQLHERVRAAGAAGAKVLRLLGDTAPVRGRAELQQRVEALDQAVLGFIG